jgi:hypothetical protein
MNIQEATEFLNKCMRDELRDHAFGDAEVSWFLDEEEVAFGYFGSRDESTSVAIGEHTFKGADARQLRCCGASERIARNDETGPNTYQEGMCMPGLTLEGVRKELTEK